MIIPLYTRNDDCSEFYLEGFVDICNIAHIDSIGITDNYRYCYYHEVKLTNYENADNFLLYIKNQNDELFKERIVSIEADRIEEYKERS